MGSADLGAIPSTLLAPKSEQRTRILPHCAILLSLLHARNRNQHSQSHWYRHFSSLRHETARLCRDLAIPLPRGHVQHRHFTTATSLRSSGKARLKADKRRAEQRLQFWINGELPCKWFNAFSQLVATTQYASLGLVLLGLLAKICAMTGTITSLERSQKENTVLLDKAHEVSKMLSNYSGAVQDEESELQKLLDRFAGPEASTNFENATLKQTKSEPALGKSGTIEQSSCVTRAHTNRMFRRGTKKRINAKDNDAIDALFAFL